MNFKDKYTVYFIKPVGFEGPIKIGLSENPARRAQEMQIWSPLPLEVLGFVPGCWADEQFLHECLIEHHSHGEWFHASTLVLDTIKAVLSAGNIECVRSTLSPVTSLRSKRNRATRAARALESQLHTRGCA